ESTVRDLLKDNPDLATSKTLLDILLSADRLTDAEAELKGLVAKYPADRDLQNMQMFILLNTRQFDKAEAVVQANLKNDPRDPLALYYNGMLQPQRGDLEGAIKELTAARDASPSNIDTRIALADTLRRKGDFERASNELEQALKLAPLRRDTRLLLVACYQQTE